MIDERALEALVDVGLDDAAAVHVGVGLHGADEVGHPLRRVLELGDEIAGGERRRDPLQRLRRRRPRERGDLLEPRDVDPRRRERLGDLPRLRDAEVLERVLQGVLGVGGVERRERRVLSRAGHRLLVQRQELLASARSTPASTNARSA